VPGGLACFVWHERPRNTVSQKNRGTTLWRGPQPQSPAFPRNRRCLCGVATVIPPRFRPGCGRGRWVRRGPPRKKLGNNPMQRERNSNLPRFPTKEGRTTQARRYLSPPGFGPGCGSVDEGVGVPSPTQKLENNPMQRERNRYFPPFPTKKGRAGEVVAYAPTSRRFHPPPCGEGRRAAPGLGVVEKDQCGDAARLNGYDPPPQPSPTRGEGARRACDTACAPMPPPPSRSPCGAAAMAPGSAHVYGYKV
jgi:hypothetical protein